ncbi:MAG: hypothetical protein A2694_01130 [Candidatus Blackburnbacteria bacterium RIFCSPHIGHO2_01_FULL_40_17]|nr:MAG: hypothetical protein UT38_C0004G0024 [Microgenomates group bacterium GW2011_GWA2_39_19]OGY07363.1 MAG: hypothetical protein A2694_01130 [Candidatus Blackburnbacteria bacterium RIFCSPHIGHO2_01_FULL_40_17]
MKNLSKFYLNLLILTTVGILTFLLYRDSYQIYFQQDEWLGFAKHMLLERQPVAILFKVAFSNADFHFFPLNFILLDLLYRAFHLNFDPYFYINLSLQAITSFAVYLLSKELFRKSWQSIICVIYFSVMSVGLQAAVWSVPGIGLHLAVIFALFSLICYLKFLKSDRKIFFFFSILSILISLLFKEIAIGLFAILPLVHFLFAKNVNKTKRYIFIVLLIGITYSLFRISLMLVSPSSGRNESYTSTFFPRTILTSMVTLPFLATSQTLIPSYYLIGLSKNIELVLSKNVLGKDIVIEYGPKIEKYTVEFTSALIFILFGCLTLFVYRRQGHKLKSKVLIFSIAFMVLNSFVYAFSPGRFEQMYVIDSRNLYFISIGTPILLVTLLTGLTKSILKVSLAIIPFLILNIVALQSDLQELYGMDFMRKPILDKVLKENPNLPQKVIFYTESDISYYGLPETERILPFQSGLGQTLLVRYYNSASLPDELLEGEFLWKITEQGYKQVEERGFGYFRDFDLLVKTMNDYNLDKTSVIAYRYDSEKKFVEDITQEVRGRVDGFRARKKMVSQIKSVSSSRNTGDILLAIDNNRETFWSSQIPYSLLMTVEVELKEEKRIAQIQIDSYNNKDQDKTSYRVELSVDKNNWEEVFYSQRYSSKGSGIKNLFFKPRFAKYIKIIQSGDHDYAPWVIHELKIFEVAN